MNIAFIFVAGFIFSSAQCYNSESFEYNGIEVSPLYETIIYGDIADIMNEFDNSNIQLEKANNESENDEDVEDLLSEYHHYLERAHKQRVNYLEKNSNKLKNKIPLVRHEKFSKMKPASAGQHTDHYKNSFYNSDHHNFAQGLNPFNMFIPYNANKYLSTSEQPAFSNNLNTFKKLLMSEKETLMPSITNIPVKPCCKDARESHPNHMQQRTSPSLILPSDEDKTFVSNNPSEQSDDTINIRIKVDVQLPKGQQDHVQYYNLQRPKMANYDAGVSKEYLSAIKLPSPYFNFPIPMNLFGYKKMPKHNKHDTSPPMHKITIHKKKKPKAGMNNKKHRKNIISFHNIKIEPQLYQTHFRMFNISDSTKNETENNNTVVLNVQNNKANIVEANLTATNPNENSNATEPQTEENILLSVNITNNLENGTNELHNTENSIETEYTNVISNATTDKTLHLRKKREILKQNLSTSPLKKNVAPHKQAMSPQNKPTTPTKKSSIPQKKSTIKKKSLAKNKSMLLVKNNSTVSKQDKEKTNITKVDRSLPADAELLYWPNKNSSKSRDNSKNITTIILESENKKAKLTISKETLRLNHTRALEQAIFGNVDWNNVDEVAPAFISFVGKYIEGILTFCNERICHSMKCSKKNCLHRVCAPKDRFNNRGHCVGSKNTDSVASMESIMDLPSNIAFEIVDILQDRMTGKLFGKITLCINLKCITFAASKKIFHKIKCTVKELDHKPHCVPSKDVKVA